MITVERLHKEDFRECMEFLDLVFSQAHWPHDFEAMVPKTNRPEEGLMQNYFGLREDGELCSAMLLWPMEAIAAGHSLRVFSIGNVATKKRCQGRGHMETVMNEVEKELETSGCDFCELGGLRQRYSRFGFEPTGIRYTFTLSLYNCQKVYRDIPAFTFSEISSEDTETVCFCRHLYENQPVYNRRGNDAEFLLHLLSFGRKPYAILDGKGNFCGYIDASEEMVVEFFTVPGTDPIAVLYAYMLAGYAKEVTVCLREWQQNLIRPLDEVCENFTSSHDHQFRIFRWDRVLEAFFDVKKEYAVLPDGEAVIGIDGWGNLNISVCGGTAKVEKTEKVPEVTFTVPEAHRYLFGPSANAVSVLTGILREWFPLPLGWNSNDCV